MAFADEETRLELNAITHPAIGIAMIKARDCPPRTDHIVVLAIPLLTALHRETVKLHKVVVVDCPTDIALERLLAQRGMDRTDAEARIRSQISPGGAGARRPTTCSTTPVTGQTSRSRWPKLWDWLAGGPRRASGAPA